MSGDDVPEAVEAAEAAPKARSGLGRRVLRRVGPFGLVACGGLAIGFALGLVLGGLIPGLREVPTPTQVTVVPQVAEGQAGEIVVPDVRGLAEKDARQALADHGITEDRIRLARVPHLIPEGYVVAQDPISGTRNPQTVTLSLPAAAVVPDLTGKHEEDARQELVAMGAQVTLSRRYDPAASPGTVLDTDPAPGEPLTDSVQVISAATPQTLYLADISSTGGCRKAAPVGVNGAQLGTSVTCSARSSEQESVWLLNRRSGALSGTLGIGDRSDPAARVRLVITGDGRELFAGELRYGASQPIQLDVAGVLRLAVTVTREDSGRGDAIAVFGEAVVTGSAEDLASLEKR